MSEPTLTPEGRLRELHPHAKTSRVRLANIIFTTVTWAQRSSTSDPERNYVYLTIGAPDVPASSAKIDLTSTSLTFSGHSDTKKVNYHLELTFYDEIDTENSQTHHTARDVEFVLRKKELKIEYWPRLLKDSKKVHFLKTNFDKVRNTRICHY